MDEANSLSEQQRLVVTAVEEGNPPDLCFEDHYELINSRGMDLPIVSDQNLWRNLTTGLEIKRIDVCFTDSKLIGIQITRGELVDPSTVSSSEEQIQAKEKEQPVL